MHTDSPTFASRLCQATVKTGTVLCVGIDPHMHNMAPVFGGPDMGYGTKQTLKQLERFCAVTLAAASGRVPAIKPQAALFEAHGHQGMALLGHLAKQAMDQNLLVIMDAKRGDIGSTAKAYAQAWLGHDAAFPSDALTINPYLGLDSLQPFFTQAKQTCSGVFILVRTSNPGSADLQQRQAEGKPVYTHLAELLAPHIADQLDPDCGLSSVGFVVGATGPQEATQLRHIAPTAPFLIPGYGTQGASAEQALSGLIKQDTKTSAQHKASYKGGLVNASRAITHNLLVQSAKTEEQAVEAMIGAIEEAKQDLSSQF